MKERVKFLVNKFKDGDLSQEEKKELYAFIEDNPEKVSDELNSLIVEHENKFEIKYSAHSKWEKIIAKIVSVDKPVEGKKTLRFWFKFAAAAVVLFGLAVTFILYQAKQKTSVYAHDVRPGGNRAMLTLANGEKISLSDAQNGDLLKEVGLSVSKKANGELIYTVDDAVGDKENNGYNTISTPNGGMWQIRLPDGSTVWLNAASSLVYPLNIGRSGKRKVKLTGEAYFEVSRDVKHPFIVETETQKLEVLGTHFNVSSYKDEPNTTTLLKGSIRVSSLVDSNNVEVLKPGEQSMLSDQKFKLNSVDAEESIAWKSGYFMFNNERQESILRKIGRWYNVEIQYADQGAKDVMYYGTMSRFDNISQVLRKFEQTGEVRFEIQGNKLIVHKQK